MRVTWAEDKEAKEHPTDDEVSVVRIDLERNADNDILIPAAREREASDVWVEKDVDVKRDFKTDFRPSISVDKTMAGQILTRSIVNTTNNVWKKCYPGAFWVEVGWRMHAPSTKGPCLGDIQPGERRKFEIVIPRFPTLGEPDLLRIAVLEDGIGWHTVEDLEVR